MEAVEWDYAAPWGVTYWKQLEGAYMLRFQAQDKSEAEDYEPSPPPSPAWYRSVWCVWR